MKFLQVLHFTAFFFAIKVVLDTLCRAQSKAFGVVTKQFVLNPKVQPVSELYGVLDPVTRDWQDGLLSKLFRDCNQDLKPNQKVRLCVFVVKASFL